jgi:hypothetical protein
MEAGITGHAWGHRGNCSPDSIGEVHHHKKRQSATVAKPACLSVFDRVRRLRFLMAVIPVVLLIGTPVATMAKGGLATTVNTDLQFSLPLR